MKFMELAAFMEQPPEHPALAAHFEQMNVAQPPPPPEDEDTTFAQFGEQGYEMRFDGPPGSPRLTSITAYPQGDSTHRPFADDLPLGIVAEDTQATLLARLGPPAFHNKRFNIDMWKLDGTGSVDMVVTYEQETAKIEKVQLNVPRKPPKA